MNKSTLIENTFLNRQERCALRLLRLLASPNKHIGRNTLSADRDADGTLYTVLFASLRAKGYITHDKQRINLVRYGDVF